MQVDAGDTAPGAAAEEMGRMAGLRGCRGIAAKAEAIRATDSDYILSSALDELELQARWLARIGDSDKRLG